MTICLYLKGMAQQSRTKRTTPTKNQKNKGGRPRRFKSPEQMRQELQVFFDNAIGKDDKGKPVVHYFPTISYAEYKLDYRHRDYKTYEEFSAVTQWAENISHAICEQLALKGDMAAPAIKLYLISKCGYTGDVVKLHSQQESQVKVDISGVLRELDKLSDDEQELILMELRNSYNEEEDDEDE